MGWSTVCEGLPNGGKDEQARGRRVEEAVKKRNGAGMEQEQCEGLSAAYDDSPHAFVHAESDANNTLVQPATWSAQLHLTRRASLVGQEPSVDQTAGHA